MSIQATQCPKCGGPIADKPARPFPVVLQSIFGISFLVFMFAFQSLRAHPVWLWIWSGAQALLGVLLMKARAASSRRVYRCIRCESAVP